MSPDTYHIINYGCQMNAYDSEIMAGILEARGLRSVREEKDADIILVNTCIVRGSAENRALGRISRLKAHKQADSDRIIAVTGCLAQRDADALLKRFPFIDLVIGTRSVTALSSLLDRVLAREGPIAYTEEVEDLFDLPVAPIRKSRLKALVTIMTGCNNFCSYCIVPYVRGREVSRPWASISAEIESLLADGCRDITLVGQNVNSYDSDGLDFAALLEKVNTLDPLYRIRYITSHPRDANSRHIDAVARLDKVCDHFHLPAQSGSTPILKRMNRGYTRDDYLRLALEVRERMPHATITTDLIVGFPGETEEDFEQTMDLVRRVRFDSAFTFYYNVRTGTKAAEWEDDAPLEVKKERLSQLIALQEKISLENNEARLGNIEEVLVEGPARRSEDPAHAGQMMGRTTGDICVIYEGDAKDAGHLVPIRVTRAAAHTLFGEKAD